MMTTQPTTQPERFAVGQRVTVKIGGQVHEMTIGDIRLDRPDGDQIAIRSTDGADHVWTHMWCAVGCVIA